MKKNLLELLTGREGYVSGEDLSQELGVSRKTLYSKMRVYSIQN